ncbi:VRR-NUC domain-containing protein [Sphingomonas laterariae]|uniref:VRR-NUC domain-containing protein n=1 Tax=Edaphosphingomonas laterariae TaxID=861865 RepID=A0A239KF45_9SPHN|nr:VRR-NUC domain-containing protein [Sphingomonas laterariae]SNT15764.1 VRR-NUC domain-containing protein [Sphingomonas laterariae]
MSEIAIQTRFRARVKMLCPAVSVVAIPNAGKRTRGAAAQVKREGLSAGFPDVMCLWSHGNDPANVEPRIAFIEFKATKGRMSENQSEWFERLARNGFDVSVQRDANEAIAWLRALGAPFLMMEAA